MSSTTAEDNCCECSAQHYQMLCTSQHPALDFPEVVKMRKHFSHKSNRLPVITLCSELPCMFVFCNTLFLRERQEQCRKYILGQILCHVLDVMRRRAKGREFIPRPWEHHKFTKPTKQFSALPNAVIM